MVEITDEVIFSKVGQLMTHLEQNKKLNDLAKEHGIELKNDVEFTKDTVMNVSVAVVAQLLAARNDDPLLKKLIRAGVEKRSTKTELVNKYKAEALELIDKYYESIGVTSSPFDQQ